MTSRSPISTQRRIAYINIEAPNKDPSTIFHSPFTNGIKNKEYSNPTLTSSNIFYDRKINIENKFAQIDSHGNPKSPQKDYSYNYCETMNDIKSYTRSRSVTPERKLSPKNSKTTRRKRQYDKSKEYIKDHFTSGLVIPVNDKRGHKKYVNSNPNIDYILKNQDQSQTIKFCLGQIEDRSLNKSSSQLNIINQHNKSEIIQNGQTPSQIQRNNSFIMNSKKNEEDMFSQFSQTDTLERPLNRKQQSIPKNKRNIQLNDIGQEQRDQTPTTLKQSSLTPTTSQQRLKLQITPLKECCNQCINKKIVQDKQQKAREEKERDQYYQQQINLLMNEEQEKQQRKSKERQVYVRKQYDQYIKTKTEEDKIKKMEQIQENILYNKKMNELVEHDKQIEIERLKQQKIQKIQIYSQQLKDQIEHKDYQRKNQAQKEKEEEQNMMLLIKSQNDFKAIKSKNHQNMVEYRDLLLNQQKEHELVKNQEKYQDQQMCKMIQEQVSKYSEQVYFDPF